MLSAGLLYLSLILAKGLVVSGAHLPVTPQIYLEECHESSKPVPKTNTAHYNPPTHFEVRLLFWFIPILTRYSLKTFEEGIEIPSAFWGNNFQDMAVNIVQDKLGLAPGEVMYNSGYDAETAEYAYLKQAHVGVRVSISMSLLIFYSLRTTFRSSMRSQTSRSRMGRLSRSGRPS